MDVALSDKLLLLLFSIRVSVSIHTLVLTCVSIEKPSLCSRALAVVKTFPPRPLLPLSFHFIFLENFILSLSLSPYTQLLSNLINTIKSNIQYTNDNCDVIT